MSGLYVLPLPRIFWMYKKHKIRWTKLPTTDFVCDCDRLVSCAGNILICVISWFLPLLFLHECYMHSLKQSIIFTTTRRVCDLFVVSLLPSRSQWIFFNSFIIIFWLCNCFQGNVCIVCHWQAICITKHFLCQLKSYPKVRKY